MHRLHSEFVYHQGWERAVLTERGNSPTQDGFCRVLKLRQVSAAIRSLPSSDSKGRQYCFVDQAKVWDFVVAVF